MRPLPPARRTARRAVRPGAKGKAPGDADLAADIDRAIAQQAEGDGGGPDPRREGPARRRWQRGGGEALAGPGGHLGEGAALGGEGAGDRQRDVAVEVDRERLAHRRGEDHELEHVALLKAVLAGCRGSGGEEGEEGGAEDHARHIPRPRARSRRAGLPA